MLEKFRLNRFCCCCTVRTGSLVIGVLGWINSLMNSIALMNQSQTVTINTHDNEKVVLEQGTNVGTILFIIFMVGISATLVWGIYQNNRRYILPWLIINFLQCCVLTIAVFVLFFCLFVFEEVGMLAILFVIVIGLTALAWYCWLCVWSLYMDMGESTFPIRPVGQPMTEPNKQYSVDNSMMYPPQEMV